MSNINNLTSKILSDAEERKASILASAEDEKNKILSKKIDKAKELEKEILVKANLESETKKERILSNAELKVRNNKLAAKQQIIDEVFVNSIDALNNLSKEAFLTFVKESIISMNISGDETLVLNSEGLSLVDDKFLKEINNALIEKGLLGNLTLSKEVGSFKGGFILEKNGVEINSTYEALVNSLRDELEYEVATVLFN
ncbi:V-type ATP synthase subunit E [Clostridium tarantellae]|uniref:V-type proton ATPase subunit E n=1 Tax=Clostridium tarantellae TaxID=39493 RepID=A0A6I1MIT8_9CLOT|nr:V-type ATP synthase subunit E family protein [Clostridium tarantellae]MPQ42834.1 V-type ATP synthase subunit E [Clostridium tarantellae]